MPFALASALVALACALASARRLVWAVAPTPLDPALLEETLAASPPADARRVLGDAMTADPRLAWEAELFDAFTSSDGDARGGLVNECLLDLDGLAQRWLRVPRVCASVATSTGFLMASIVLLRSLGAPAEDDAAAAFHGALAQALGAFAAGLAGASFCAAAHVRGRRALGSRLASTGKLIERLEALASRPPGLGPSPTGRM